MSITPKEKAEDQSAISHSTSPGVRVVEDHRGSDSEPQLGDASAPKPTSLQDAARAFAASTVVPEAFSQGPVKGIAKPVTISVGSPDGSRFVMIDPNPEFTRSILLFQDPSKLAGRTGNTYAISGPVAERLTEQYPESIRLLRQHDVYVCTCRHSSELVLFPVKQPTSHPLSIDAYAEKRVWIEACMQDWFRVAFNSETKQYDLTPTEVPNQEKADFQALYQGMTFDELLFKGFRDHYIDDWDHAVLREYRGV